MAVVPGLGRSGWHILANASRQELPLWQIVWRDYCPYKHQASWSKKAPHAMGQMASVASHVPTSLSSTLNMLQWIPGIWTVFFQICI